MIKKITYTFFFLIIGSIFYLSFFGLSTNKFNNNIEKKIKENYSNIDLKLNDIKLLLNISKLSIDLETKNPLILLGKDKIKLANISTNYSLKSFFKKEFAIKNLLINSEKNQIKKFLKLARSHKDSAQLLILDKLIKSGYTKISIKLNFDQKGKIIGDEYEILADIDDLTIDLFNKRKINNISANLKYFDNTITINNLKSNYKGIEFYSQNITLSREKNFFFVNGDLYNTENEIPSLLLKTFFKMDNIKNVVLSSKNNFSFKISKKLKISNLELISNINLKKADIEFQNDEIQKYIPNFSHKISFLDQSIKINYKKKILLEGFGKFQIDNNLDNIKYIVELDKDNTKFDLEFDVNNIPFKIDLINFAKEKNESLNFKIKGEKNKNNYKLKNINIKKNNDKLNFENIIISKDNKIVDFKKINLEYIDIYKIKNDILISQNNKNNFLVKGNRFNLSKIIDHILFDDSNKKNLFDKKERIFKIKFKKNYIDNDHHILNLQGNFKIKGNEVYDLFLKSSFPNKDILSMSIKSKNGQKITNLYSEQAKPFVKKYKFIKGFERGKLDFYSVKQNKISKSQLKIFEFSLKELPALTKILTLASLQGIADILSGDGVSFDELEINFENEKNLMKIEELYAIGPAISIMMDGYVQKDELISLRGTLVPATTINKFVGSIPILGDILVGKKTGEGVFGVSFKLKGPPKDIKTTVNPIKTLTPRFITRTLEKIKKKN